MAKPTVYTTPLPGFPYGKQFFQKLPCWAAIRDKLPFRLRCLPLKKIPRRAPLILVNNVVPTPETLHLLHNRFSSNLHLIQWEPPTVLPYQHTPACYSLFSRIYTLRDDLTDPKFRKFYLPHSLKSRPPNHQRLLTMVFGNKASSHPNQLYTERRRLIEFFEQTPGADFTFYGTGWEHLGYRTYGGTTDDKLATLSTFRFTVAYENTHSIPGIITEKPLDCLCAGTVPIYWGAPNITDYIPADCFIDRTQFPSDQALYDYLLTLDPSPYLAAAQRFLSSEKASLFSEERFIGQVTADIREAMAT
jgi:alpha(1,3/1,4) fucosyltransferase